MSAIQDKLRQVARDVVDDIEAATGETLTAERRDRSIRAAETILAYPFFVIGVGEAEKAKATEARDLALSTLANTSMAIVIDGRRQVEKICRERFKQVMVLLLQVAGIAVRV
jgi:hypothetical protein